MNNKLGQGVGIAGVWVAIGLVGFHHPEAAVAMVIPAAWATAAIAFFM